MRNFSNLDISFLQSFFQYTSNHYSFFSLEYGIEWTIALIVKIIKKKQITPPSAFKIESV